MRLLFITWDGPEASYHESLFLPIFARLSVAGFDVHMLQFTWGADAQVQARTRAARDAGVRYTAVRVWRGSGLMATAAMVARGAARITRYVRQHGITVLMPRSIIALAMALAARRMLPRVRLF